MFEVGMQNFQCLGKDLKTGGGGADWLSRYCTSTQCYSSDARRYEGKMQRRSTPPAARLGQALRWEKRDGIVTRVVKRLLLLGIQVTWYRRASPGSR